jgi:hypothetical protein
LDWRRNRTAAWSQPVTGGLRTRRRSHDQAAPTAAPAVQADRYQ